MYIYYSILPLLLPLVINSNCWPKTFNKNSSFSSDQASFVPTNEIHSRQKRMVEIVLGGLFAGAMVGRHYKRKMKKYKKQLRMVRYGQKYPYSYSKRPPPPYRQYPPQSYPYHRPYRSNPKYRRLLYLSGYFPTEFGQNQEMDRQKKIMRRNGQQEKSSEEKMPILNGVYPNPLPEIISPPSNAMIINPNPSVATNLVPSAQNTMPNVPNPPPTTSNGFIRSALGAIGQTAPAAAFTQPLAKSMAPAVIKTGLSAAGSAFGMAALGPVALLVLVMLSSNYLSSSLFPQNRNPPDTAIGPSTNPINSPPNPITTP